MGRELLDLTGADLEFGYRGYGWTARDSHEFYSGVL